MRHFMLLVLGFALLTSGGPGLAAENLPEFVTQSPSRLVCEISPRGGDKQTFIVFHLAAFSDEGMVTYRAFTTPPWEITTMPGQALSAEGTPCLTDPVAFD